MTPAQTTNRRAAGIDGLRAIAALSVLGYHAWLYSMATPTTAHQGSVWAQGTHELRLGLVLFFVLSAATVVLMRRTSFAPARPADPADPALTATDGSTAPA